MDEGHLNVVATESKVATRSSEFKVPQVEQVVVIGVGDPQSAPPVGIIDSEVTFKPSTTGTSKLISSSFDRPDPPPDATSGSVDVPARPERASQGRHTRVCLSAVTRSITLYIAVNTELY